MAGMRINVSKNSGFSTVMKRLQPSVVNVRYVGEKAIALYIVMYPTLQNPLANTKQVPHAESRYRGIVVRSSSGEC